MRCIRVTLEICFADCLFPLLRLLTEPAIFNHYAVVFPQTVFCRDVVESALVTVIKSGNFIPFTQIRLKLKSVDRLNTFWNAGAGT